MLKFFSYAGLVLLALCGSSSAWAVVTDVAATAPVRAYPVLNIVGHLIVLIILIGGNGLWFGGN